MRWKCATCPALCCTCVSDSQRWTHEVELGLHLQPCLKTVVAAARPAPPGLVPAEATPPPRSSRTRRVGGSLKWRERRAPPGGRRRNGRDTREMSQEPGRRRLLPEPTASSLEPGGGGKRSAVPRAPSGGHGLSRPVPCARRAAPDPVPEQNGSFSFFRKTKCLYSWIV